jgi:hypothetical protein
MASIPRLPKILKRSYGVEGQLRRTFFESLSLNFIQSTHLCHWHGQIRVYESSDVQNGERSADEDEEAEDPCRGYADENRKRHSCGSICHLLCNVRSTVVAGKTPHGRGEGEEEGHAAAPGGRVLKLIAEVSAER